jgi:ferredoxin-NADP reductase
VIYRTEFDALAAGDRGFEAFFTFTRQAPPGWTGFQRRIDPTMLGEVIKPFGAKARVYVCGPTLLVEWVATALVQMRLPIEHIRTERFGPTGV